MKYSYLILAFFSFLSLSAYSQGGIGDPTDPDGPCASGYTAYYADMDGDGYGDPNNIVCLLGAQPGYTLNNADCNDANPNIHPMTYWYRDADGDGSGNINDWKRQCLQPTGYVLNSADCDDTNSSTTNCPTETAVPPSNQSFESGFSPWIQDTADNLDWSRTSGTTPSSGTGPTAASDGTYYIFTESSSNYVKTFNLISPLLDINSGLDFTFNYHMYGTAMGSLTLSVSTNGGSSWTQLWSASGNKGSSWLSQTISLSPYMNSEIKLRFSGVTGSSYTSDIALDNLKFTAQAPAPCAVILSAENYVFKRTYKVPQTESLATPTKEQVIEEVTYLDGLGRPMQHVGIRQGGGTACEDLITHIEYDPYGRESKNYLPHPDGTNIGKYRTSTTAISNTNSFYTSNYDTDFTSNVINPYSETLFEASPLNRPLQQGAPGAAWAVNNHSIKFGYGTNSFDPNNPTNAANDNVRLFTVSLSTTYVPTLLNSGFYQANQLFKNITKDENWTTTSGKNNTTEEFKDKQGRVVLKRTYNAGAAHDTYYVYDDYGNLTYVIPPKVVTSDGISTTELAELCYQYRYDGRNRLIEKKIPGKGTAANWESIVYNKLDQPIMTQDPNLKAQGKWLFTKYDAFGRVAYTGIVTRTTTTSRTTVQSEADGFAYQYEERPGSAIFENRTVYYTNRAYPNSGISEIHTENYYDTYLTSSAQAGITVPSANTVGENISTATKGLSTVSKVRVLDTSNWITTVSAYDKKGRINWSKSINSFLGTTDLVENDLDFIGNIEVAKATHSKSGQPTIVTVDNFTYDHVNRLKTHTQSINGSTSEVIASNEYDKLGLLKSKGVGNEEGKSRLQTVDYNYNIRGWLAGINNTGGSNSTIGIGTNDLFGFQINYNKPTDLTKAIFNGNISQTLWRSKNTDQNQRSYLYTYDHLNRITSAMDNSSDTRYSLSSVAYDKNGNITNLTRRGAINSTSSSFGEMDKLAYYYDSGNKLRIVSDAGNDTFGFKDDLIGTSTDTSTDYTYDVNGNMLTDSNKGITGITYNHLNLPKTVSIGGGTITYIYDATGVKQRKVAGTTTTDYAGNYMYKNNVLQFFNHPEGYVENNAGTYKYHYQYKDHLGNIRLSYFNNGTASSPSVVISEENNYYPFGLRHKGYNDAPNGYGNSAAKMFKFGGKELQDEAIGGKNIDWYDFGARNYDAALGRWMNIDPLSEFMFTHSPYNFAFNNPLYYTDPDGRSPEKNCPEGTCDENPIVLNEVIVVAPKKQEPTVQNENSFWSFFQIRGGWTIWGNNNHGGSMDGLKGTTEYSINSDDIPTMGSGQANKMDSGKLWESLLELLDNLVQTWEKVDQIKKLTEDENLTTMEVLKDEPIVPSSSENVHVIVSYQRWPNGQTFTKRDTLLGRNQEGIMHSRDSLVQWRYVFSGVKTDSTNVQNITTYD